jgi:hypothetical protein
MRRRVLEQLDLIVCAPDHLALSHNNADRHLLLKPWPGATLIMKYVA